MASAAHEQLLGVQDLDTKITQLNHRHANHPIRADIAAAEAERATLGEVIAEIEGRKHDLDRQQKRIDDEVALIDDKRSQIDAKLYDGSVTATKDLLALQDEAKMLLDRKTSMEDDELELMEQNETVQNELDPQLALRDEIDARLASSHADLEAALAEVDEELQQVQSARNVAAADVPADLLSQYDSLRLDFGGIAVARLVGSTCDGCHMAMSAVAIDKIKKLPDDAVVTCDECGRLLIR